MTTTLPYLISGLASLLVGIAVGVAFGYWQKVAASKNQQLYGNGKLGTPWAVVPGSMRRTAGFLILLAAIQIICPLIFNGGFQWWVSGGVAAGYGWCLYRNLRRRMANN
ncbi:MAG TPA: hypothetical protein VGO67_22525 [Verrucomicrobiae bacterium]|jgi:hypothetical protein